jgi:hypothetical protein
MTSPDPPKQQKPSAYPFVLTGAGAGGCLLPLLAFIACAGVGDTGGPLFWPLAWPCVGIPLAVVGALVGLCIWAHVSSKNNGRSIKGAAPNGGQATPLGNSGVTEGPPSVS